VVEIRHFGRRGLAARKDLRASSVPNGAKFIGKEDWAQWEFPQALSHCGPVMLKSKRIAYRNIFMNTADEFLAQKEKFQLGDLPTESPHPKTLHLSQWAKGDIAHGLEVMREVDLDALNRIVGLRRELGGLFGAVARALDDGSRIFLIGCGATGRLSLSLDYLWRRKFPGSTQVRSLMAGGDVALVHSLEGFEDFPAYGARHLLELGFGPDDLLIGSTEGGETPYVIGAVEKAAEMCRHPPQFLCCNPRQLLIDRVERSRRVLTDPRIQSYCLETGPMALTGSTRMQASTVLMLVIGLALDFGRDVDGAFAALEQWIDFLIRQEVAPLEPFIVSEAQTYLDNGHTRYASDDYAITVFTDTTERAPTFNLAPFDNPKALTDRHSLTYLMIPSAASAEESWRHLLAREPWPLEWPDIHPKATKDYLLSFDFGRGALAFRERLLGPPRIFAIDNVQSRLNWSFAEAEERFTLPGSLPLLDHLTLKLLLNMHSTLMMGRLGRFEGNLMTWVYPSNGKLIDRAARYTDILLRAQGFRQFTYDDIIRAQFAVKSDLSPQESIVHKTIRKLIGVPVAR
jgi:N-acetylmuramic acid 6-phosphate etherase